MKKEIHSVASDDLRAAVIQELHQKRRTKSSPTVIWRTASGRVVATSHSALPAKPQPAEASSESLMAIAKALAAEGMATADPAKRSALLNAAGSASIKASAVHASRSFALSGLSADEARVANAALQSSDLLLALSARAPLDAAQIGQFITQLRVYAADRANAARAPSIEDRRIALRLADRMDS